MLIPYWLNSENCGFQPYLAEVWTQELWSSTACFQVRPSLDPQPAFDIPHLEVETPGESAPRRLAMENQTETHW